MSLDDIKHAMPNSLSGKLVATVLTACISGGGTWMISTTVADHSAISVLAEDIHNLIAEDRYSKTDTDAEISRVVSIQEKQTGEISRLEQAVQDGLKIQMPSPP